MVEESPATDNPGHGTDLPLGEAASDEPLPRRSGRLEDYRKRILTALIRFMPSCPPAVRVGLDEFQACVTWDKNNTSPAAPRKATRHRNDRSRCQFGLKTECAEFHFADAVQVYHAAINQINHPILWGISITGLGWRVRLLEGIARTGFDGCAVDGSESTGYRMVDHPSAIKTRDYAPIFGNSKIGNEPEDKSDRGEQPT